MDFERAKPAIDIYDLCSILNTVGFVVIDEEKSKQIRSSGRRIEITCNVSHKKIYLESNSSECICWRHAVHDDSEKWEMSGTSGGVQTTKMESSITSWKELPKNVLNSIEKTMQLLVDMVRGTKNVSNNSFRECKNASLNCIDARLNKIKADCELALDDSLGKKSRSTMNINTSGLSEILQVKEEHEITRRSLDTIIDMATDPMLPEPGILKESKKTTGMIRQNTYTTSPKSECTTLDAPARTSSPVPSLAKHTLRKLIIAERLSNDLANIIQETKKMIEEETEYPGLSPYSVMDVSKISQSKAAGESMISANNLSIKSANVYASSPNLSAKHESRIPSSGLKRLKSVSTQKLGVSNSNIPAKTVNLQKSNSLRKTIPKKLSTFASISPTFGSGRKSLGPGTILGSQLPGTYKTFGERMSLGGATKDTDPKKRGGLYSQIKPTIQRYTTATKK